MPRNCQVCASPDRYDVDTALLAHDSGYRQIAVRFGLHESAVYRHQREHLQLTLTESKELGRMLSAENLVARLSDLEARTQRALDYAERTGDYKMLAVFIVIARDNLEAYMRFAPYVDADKARQLPPPTDLRASYTDEEVTTALRTMIEAGMAERPEDGEPSREVDATEVEATIDEEPTDAQSA